MSQGRGAAEPIRLSGDWQFQLDPAGELDISSIRPDRTIPVPMPWQAAFPELRQYSGYAWYRRDFELDAAFVRNEARLHFGAVDYWRQVFVNGELVGEHEGGYTPFAFNIGRHLKAGANRVYDSAQEALVTERWRDPARERP